MDIQKIPIDKIKPAKYNPRKNLKKGDAEYEKLKRSIEEFGYVEPIIWNKRSGNIVGGHQRFKILEANGINEIECVVVDLDEEREKALNIALNKIKGEFDIPLLTDLLKELDDLGFDINLTGFDAAEISALFGETQAKEDDFDLEKATKEIDKVITQRGDIWILGDHKLICGDCTKAEEMDTLMENDFADLILTDPPYNCDYEGATKEKLKIMNDKMKDAEFLKFLTKAFNCMNKYSKKGAPIYVFHADSEGYNFRAAFKNSGYVLRQCLVWQKNSMVMGRQDYHWAHEPILYGWKTGAAHSWYGDRKQTTLIKFDRPHRSTEHPTMKPVGLCAYFISNSSKEGDLIIDFFAGSGTTLIASEQLGRKCYSAELDPKYCDVIVKRWIGLKETEEGVFLLRGSTKLSYDEAKNSKSDTQKKLDFTAFQSD